jgi:hypothetical protein
MWMMMRHDRALSETFSIVIICILIVIAAVLITASLTGVITNMLQKPALFSVQVVPYNSDDSYIGVFHQEGDAVILNGTTQTKGVSIVSLVIASPDGSEHQINAVQATMVHDSWGPGDMLYIYSTDHGVSYVYSDADPGSSVSSLSLTGMYTVKITDDKMHVIIHTFPVTVQ